MIKISNGWEMAVPIDDFPTYRVDKFGNVYNSKAKEFYLNHSVDVVAYAFEKKIAQGAELMRCRHCIRYMLGECPKYHKKTGHKAPFYLRLSDGQSFRMDFDCARCEMTVSI